MFLATFKIMDKKAFIKLLKDDPMAFSYVVDACIKLRRILYKNEKKSRKLLMKSMVHPDVWFKACDAVEETLKV